MRRTSIAPLLFALSLAGCGSSSSAQTALPNASLVLDFTPNAVHAGIYEALARRDDVRAGVHLHVIVPSASTDSIRLLETGRVNFAILDIHDLAIARERGQDIVGIMAIVQRPLAAVIAAPSVASPRALAGQTVGITGVPSDTAVLKSIVAGAGGTPEPRQDDHDRLQRRRGPACRTRRSRDRVLERRGRDRADATTRASTSSGSISTAPRHIRSSSFARPAHRCAPTRGWHARSCAR